MRPQQQEKRDDIRDQKRRAAAPLRFARPAQQPVEAEQRSSGTSVYMRASRPYHRKNGLSATQQAGPQRVPAAPHGDVRAGAQAPTTSARAGSRRPPTATEGRSRCRQRRRISPPSSQEVDEGVLVDGGRQRQAVVERELAEKQRGQRRLRAAASSGSRPTTGSSCPSARPGTRRPGASIGARANGLPSDEKCARKAKKGSSIHS